MYVVRGAGPPILRTFPEAMDPEEFNKLLDVLRDEHKNLVVSKDILSHRSLSSLVVHRPRVLHVNCHGGFIGDQFHLAFEGDADGQHVGVCDMFSVQRLRELLSPGGIASVDVVFINSCHSFHAGQIFSNAGVPHVVAVHSQTKVLDEACQKFAQFFYLALAQGDNVEDAFRVGQATVKTAVATAVQTAHLPLLSCCCSHSHKPHCPWVSLLKTVGEKPAHHIHVPDSRCRCAEMHAGVHVPTCEWLRDYLSRTAMNRPDLYDGRSLLITHLPRTVTAQQLSEALLLLDRGRRPAGSASNSAVGLSHFGLGQGQDGQSASSSGSFLFGSTPSPPRSNFLPETDPDTSSPPATASLSLDALWPRPLPSCLEIVRTKEARDAHDFGLARFASVEDAQEVLARVTAASIASASPPVSARDHHPAAQPASGEAAVAELARTLRVSALRVCCCSPELPHDESMKFLLLVNREAVRARQGRNAELRKGSRPWSHLMRGELKLQTRENPAHKPPFPGRGPFIGRNRETWELMSHLEQGRRLISVCGARGIGKSSFARAAVHYLYQRSDRYKNGVLYVDFQTQGKSDVQGVEDLVANIVQALGVDFVADARALHKLLEEWRGVLVLNGCDGLLTEHRAAFVDFVETLLASTHHLVLLTTSRDELPVASAVKMMLKRLDEQSAAALFAALAGRFLPREYHTETRRLGQHPVLQMLAGHPQSIQNLAPLLQDKTLDELEKELQSRNLSDLRTPGPPPFSPTAAAPAPQRASSLPLPSSASVPVALSSAADQIGSPTGNSTPTSAPVELATPPTIIRSESAQGPLPAASAAAGQSAAAASSPKDARLLAPHMIISSSAPVVAIAQPPAAASTAADKSQATAAVAAKERAKEVKEGLRMPTTARWPSMTFISDSSLNSSLMISATSLQKASPAAFRLLRLMSLFPSGLLSEDLDLIWTRPHALSHEPHDGKSKDTDKDKDKDKESTCSCDWRPHMSRLINGQDGPEPEDPSQARSWWVQHQLVGDHHHFQMSNNIACGFIERNFVQEPDRVEFCSRALIAFADLTRFILDSLVARTPTLSSQPPSQAQSQAHSQEDKDPSPPARSASAGLAGLISATPWSFVPLPGHSTALMPAHSTELSRTLSSASTGERDRDRSNPPTPGRSLPSSTMFLASSPPQHPQQPPAASSFGNAVAGWRRPRRRRKDRTPSILDDSSEDSMDIDHGDSDQEDEQPQQQQQQEPPVARQLSSEFEAQQANPEPPRREAHPLDADVAALLLKLQEPNLFACLDEQRHKYFIHAAKLAQSLDGQQTQGATAVLASAAAAQSSVILSNFGQPAKAALPFCPYTPLGAVAVNLAEIQRINARFKSGVRACELGLDAAAAAQSVVDAGQCSLECIPDCFVAGDVWISSRIVAAQGTLQALLGRLCMGLEDVPRALSSYNNAQKFLKKAGDRHTEGKVLMLRGMAEERVRNYQAALSDYGVALEHFAAVNDDAACAETLKVAGVLKWKLGSGAYSTAINSNSGGEQPTTTTAAFQPVPLTASASSIDLSALSPHDAKEAKGDKNRDAASPGPAAGLHIDTRLSVTSPTAEVSPQPGSSKSPAALEKAKAKERDHERDKRHRELEQARNDFSRSLQLFQNLAKSSDPAQSHEARVGQGSALKCLARLFLSMGLYRQALDSAKAALALYQQMGDKLREADAGRLLTETNNQLLTKQRAAQNLLVFMRTSPLVAYDEQNRVQPMEKHDADAEWALLAQVAHGSGRSLQIRQTIARIETLKRWVKIGCQVLHFSGAYYAGLLPLEDGLSGTLDPLYHEQIPQLLSSSWSVGIELVFLDCSFSRHAHAARIHHPRSQNRPDEQPPQPEEPSDRSLSRKERIERQLRVARKFLEAGVQSVVCSVYRGSPPSHSADSPVQSHRELGSDSRSNPPAASTTLTYVTRHSAARGRRESERSKRARGERALLDSGQVSTPFVCQFYASLFAGETILSAFNKAKERLGNRLPRPKSHGQAPSDDDLFGIDYVLLPENRPDLHNRVLFPAPVAYAGSPASSPAQHIEQERERELAISARPPSTPREPPESPFSGVIVSGLGAGSTIASLSGPVPGFVIKAGSGNTVEDRTPWLCPTNLLPLPPLFFGRNVQVHKAILALTRHKVLNLFGPEGVGKNTLASAIAHYTRDRQRFEDGVFMVDMTSSTNAKDIRNAVADTLNIRPRPQNAVELFATLNAKSLLLLLDAAAITGPASPSSGSAYLSLCWFVQNLMLLSNVRVIIISTMPMTSLMHEVLVAEREKAALAANTNTPSLAASSSGTLASTLTIASPATAPSKPASMSLSTSSSPASDQPVARSLSSLSSSLGSSPPLQMALPAPRHSPGVSPSPSPALTALQPPTLFPPSLRLESELQPKIRQRLRPEPENGAVLNAVSTSALALLKESDKGNVIITLRPSEPTQPTAAVQPVPPVVVPAVQPQPSPPQTSQVPPPPVLTRTSSAELRLKQQDGKQGPTMSDDEKLREAIAAGLCMPVGPLDARTSARLLLNTCSRRVEMSEIELELRGRSLADDNGSSSRSSSRSRQRADSTSAKRSFEGYDDSDSGGSDDSDSGAAERALVNALARHPLIRKLAGHPDSIYRAAVELSNRHLSDVNRSLPSFSPPDKPSMVPNAQADGKAQLQPPQGKTKGNSRAPSPMTVQEAANQSMNAVENENEDSAGEAGDDAEPEAEAEPEVEADQQAQIEVEGEAAVDELDNVAEAEEEAEAEAEPGQEEEEGQDDQEAEQQDDEYEQGQGQSEEDDQFAAEGNDYSRPRPSPSMRIPSKGKGKDKGQGATVVGQDLRSQPKLIEPSSFTPPDSFMSKKLRRQSQWQKKSLEKKRSLDRIAISRVVKATENSALGLSLMPASLQRKISEQQAKVQDPSKREWRRSARTQRQAEGKASPEPAVVSQTPSAAGKKAGKRGSKQATTEATAPTPTGKHKGRRHKGQQQSQPAAAAQPQPQPPSSRRRRKRGPSLLTQSQSAAVVTAQAPEQLAVPLSQEDKQSLASLRVDPRTQEQHVAAAAAIALANRLYPYNEMLVQPDREQEGEGLEGEGEDYGEGEQSDGDRFDDEEHSDWGSIPQPQRQGSTTSSRSTGTSSTSIDWDQDEHDDDLQIDERPNSADTADETGRSPVSFQEQLAELIEQEKEVNRLLQHLKEGARGVEDDDDTSTVERSAASGGKERKKNKQQEAVKTKKTKASKKSSKRANQAHQQRVHQLEKKLRRIRAQIDHSQAKITKQIRSQRKHRSESGAALQSMVRASGGKQAPTTHTPSAHRDRDRDRPAAASTARDDDVELDPWRDEDPVDFEGDIDEANEDEQAHDHDDGDGDGDERAFQPRPVVEFHSAKLKQKHEQLERMAMARHNPTRDFARGSASRGGSQWALPSRPHAAGLHPMSAVVGPQLGPSYAAVTGLGFAAGAFSPQLPTTRGVPIPSPSSRLIVRPRVHTKD